MNECVRSVGWMVLRGEFRNTGSETLYSVCYRWMNWYGTSVEWYWLAKPVLLGEKHYIALVVGDWIGMERWWSVTDRGKQKCCDKIIIQCGYYLSEWLSSFGGMVFTRDTDVLREKFYRVWLVSYWMFMERWWNGTYRGIRSSGRETYYGVCASWMNEYGAFVDLYWQGKQN